MVNDRPGPDLAMRDQMHPDAVLSSHDLIRPQTEKPAMMCFFSSESNGIRTRCSEGGMLETIIERRALCYRLQANELRIYFTCQPAFCIYR